MDNFATARNGEVGGSGLSSSGFIVVSGGGGSEVVSVVVGNAFPMVWLASS